MHEKQIYLFKIAFQKGDIWNQQECYVLSDSYDHAERIALENNNDACQLNISKIAATNSTLFFDESEIAIFSESHL